MAGRASAVIAITAGDPCGIGPEVILKALARPGGHGGRAGAGRRAGRARLVVIGDLPVFEQTARRLRLRLPAWRVVAGTTTLPVAPLVFLDCASAQRFVPGRASRAAGAASLAYLERAVRLWRAGRLAGLVTGPVTKWAAAKARPGFIGHTEFLAQAMGCRDIVMAFVSDRLRVALMTRHVPLGAVPRLITPALVRNTAVTTARALRQRFRISNPRLAVCGINPHAGEAGRFGREDERVIRPAVAALRRRGIRCDGPFAADGLFACLLLRSRRQAEAARYDAIICAYHDQGLIPFKMTARDTGCQVTLGLPVVRTSPDHGSALDIAGKGIAHPGSMRYALCLAESLAAAGGGC